VLDAGIHVFLLASAQDTVDGRVKPGDDDLAVPAANGDVL
jgi:hypothetical protein